MVDGVRAVRTAGDNRQFLGRAVRYLVGTARPPVRQIVDIGSGLPTLGQVHSVAHLGARDTRIVYVDYDPGRCRRDPGTRSTRRSSAVIFFTAAVTATPLLVTNK